MHYLTARKFRAERQMFGRCVVLRCRYAAFSPLREEAFSILDFCWSVYDEHHAEGSFGFIAATEYGG